jgi:flagellar biosynthesis protein FlhB
LAKREGRNQAPTAKRKHEARREGRLPRSPEIAPVVSLLMVVVAGSAMVPGILVRTSTELHGALSNLGDGRQIAWGQLSRTASHLALAWLPILLVGSIAGIAATIAQGGVVLGSKQAKPSLKNLSLKRGFGRLSPKQALPKLGKSLVKVGILTFAGWGPGRKLWAAARTGHAMTEMVATTGRAIGSFLQQAVVGLLVLAAVDYALARRKWANGLKMTRQEVVDESKLSEGDPRLKASRRRRAFDIARRRALPPLSLADVIVTNPTHFAVALAYVPGSPAPRVIAKGTNAAAARIRREGARHGVPVIENRPLARALYRQCKIGAYIPEKLFDDVVSVLVSAYYRRGRYPAFLTNRATA